MPKKKKWGDIKKMIKENACGTGKKKPRLDLQKIPQENVLKDMTNWFASMSPQRNRLVETKGSKITDINANEECVYNANEVNEGSNEVISECTNEYVKEGANEGVNRNQADSPLPRENPASLNCNFDSPHDQEMLAEHVEDNDGGACYNNEEEMRRITPSRNVSVDALELIRSASKNMLSKSPFDGKQTPVKTQKNNRVVRRMLFSDEKINEVCASVLDNVFNTVGTVLSSLEGIEEAQSNSEVVCQEEILGPESPNNNLTVAISNSRTSPTVEFFSGNQDFIVFVGNVGQTSWTKGLKTVYFLAPDLKVLCFRLEKDVSFSDVIPELSSRWNSSSFNKMIVTFKGEKLDENSSVFQFDDKSTFLCFDNMVDENYLFKGGHSGIDTA